MRQLGSLAVPKRRASRAQGEAKQMEVPAASRGPGIFALPSSREAITGPGPGKAISAAASQVAGWAPALSKAPAC